MAATGSAADMGNGVKNVFLDNKLVISYLAAGIVAVVLWQIVVKMFRGSKSTLNLPPGPRNLPLVGAMLSVEATDIAGWYKKMSQKYGKLFYFRLGSHHTIVVCSAEGAKEVLKTKDALFANRPNQAFLKSSAKYHGFESEDVLFSNFDEKHKNLKKLIVNSFFTVAQLKRFEHVRRPEAAFLVEDVQRQMNSDGIIDVGGTLFNKFVNLLCSLLFGRRHADSPIHDKDVMKDFPEVIQLHTILGLQVNIGDVFPWLARPANFLGLSNEKTLREFGQRCRFMLGQIVEEHKEAKRSNKNYEDRSFLDVMLSFQEKENISDNAIQGTILDMLVGGTDTNAMTAVWAMVELARNPDMQAKLRKELDEVVGKERPLEESDLPNLPYLHAIINETFRTHVATPLLVPHFTLEATTLQGFYIPANTTVFLNIGLISRDPEYWEDPMRFDPERFMNLEEKINVTEGNLFTLFPFGSGRRKCVAAGMGLITVQRTVATLIHAFVWTPPPGKTPDDVDKGEIVNGIARLRSPLMLCAKPRLNPDVYSQLHVERQM